MDPVSNPFSPGAGTVPPYLAGRDEDLGDFQVIIGRAMAGKSFQPMILFGIVGTGKTALLVRFCMVARESGWVAELIEARPGGDIRVQVAEALPPLVRSVNRNWRNKEMALKIGRVAASFARNVQATIARGNIQLNYEPETGVADSGDLEDDLTDLLLALGVGAREEGVGAAFFIDELHEVPAQHLSPIIGAAHRVAQEKLPVVISGAGLPGVGSAVSAVRSYGSRLFLIRPVGPLNGEAVRRAFEVPIEDSQASIDPDALDNLVSTSGGYPYQIQMYGKHTWDVAETTTISQEDVALACRRAYQELVHSVFHPHYYRATPAERRYLRAMADLDYEPVMTNEVASLLGHKSSTQASVQRDGLLGKGLVYAPDWGQLSFMVPQFGQYLRGLPEQS